MRNKKIKKEELKFYPGDLVLLKGIGNVSDNLVKAQKVRSLSTKPRFSHVAISMGMNTFIHSSGNGVALVPYYEIFNRSYYEPNWRFLRNKKLEELIETEKLNEEKIRAICLYYLGQEYNIKFGKKKFVDNNKFCSELAGRIYEILKLPIHNKPSFKTYPYHVQRLEESDNWKNVTDIYTFQFDYDTMKKEAEELLETIKESNDTEFVEIFESQEESDADHLDKMNRLIAENYILTTNEIRKFVLDSAKLNSMIKEYAKVELDNEVLLKNILDVLNKQENILDFWDVE